jgi:Conserved hypothetical protein 2217 (DUF2460)
MSSFPKLKSGSVMQYPATREVFFANTVLRFVDGTQQCYRKSQDAMRRWLVRLDLLDEVELSNLQTFFVSERGRSGSFSFTDPWDQAVYQDCSLDQDSFEFELSGETRAQAVLIVKQNRS